MGVTAADADHRGSTSTTTPCARQPAALTRPPPAGCRDLPAGDWMTRWLTPRPDRPDRRPRDRRSPVLVGPGGARATRGRSRRAAARPTGRSITRPTRPTLGDPRDRRPRHRRGTRRRRGAGRRDHHPRASRARRRPAGPAAAAAGPLPERARPRPARPALPRPARRGHLGGDRGHPDHRRRRRRARPRSWSSGCAPGVRVEGARRPRRCATSCARSWSRWSTRRWTAASRVDRRRRQARRSCWWSASTAPARPPPSASSPGSWSPRTARCCSAPPTRSAPPPPTS